MAKEIEFVVIQLSGRVGIYYTDKTYDMVSADKVTDYKNEALTQSLKYLQGGE